MLWISSSVAVNIRWQAVLYFKNGVDRYWRRNAPNGLSEEEKVGLRSGLAKTVTEPVNQIAVQLAVIVAKAARYERKVRSICTSCARKLRDNVNNDNLR